MLAGFNTFRLRLTFSFGGLLLMLGVSLFSYTYWAASERLALASGDALTSIGTSIANVLATTLMEREREVVLLSKRPMFHGKYRDMAGVRSAIDQVQASYVHYAWIGFADRQGQVVAASKGLLEGVSVAQRPWFSKGQDGPFIGDVHEAVLLAKKLPAPTNNEPLRFVDFAAPVRDDEGQLLGVVATHANWSWVESVLASSVPADSQRQEIEVFILSSQNKLLYPYAQIGKLDIPPDLPADGSSAALIWPDGTQYLSSQVRVKANTSTDLGWKIIVRQPVNKALQSVIELHHRLLYLGGLATLICMFLAYRLASQLSRPVEALAKIAISVQQGKEDAQFDIPSSLHEVRSLCASLQAMTASLLTRKHALQEINTTLEDKVEQRTAALAAANQELEQLSRRDALTGLHNRLAADEMLAVTFKRWQEAGTAYAILLLDVDHFKHVNDQHGHEAGDLVLKHIASVLSSSLRTRDFLARFGGEEFLIVLPEVTESAALNIAEKIRQAIADADTPVVKHSTISIGVAVSAAADARPDDAVHRADVAMYRAKAKGRNQACAARHED